MEQGDRVPLQTCVDSVNYSRVVHEDCVESPHHKTYHTEMFVIPAVQIRETEAQREGVHKWIAGCANPRPLCYSLNVEGRCPF